MLFLFINFVKCLILFLICVSSESYQNPGANSIILCGLTEICSIICNTSHSCSSSQFYLYNNEAYIECSGVFSCDSVKIISINATSLTMNLNGSNAFHHGIAYIEQPNQHIHIQCINELACSDASFYHNGIGQTVDHYCNHPSSCYNTLISAIFIDSIHIQCNAISSCNNMDIYMPMNINTISTINITAMVISTHIYSIHGTTNLDIICNGDCQDPDKFSINDMYIIYGIQYQFVCPIYEQSLCTNINSLAFNEDDNITIIYYDDGDYNDLNLNHLQILLFIFPSKMSNSTSNLIQSHPSSSFIHVICVDTNYYPSCNNIYFNLSTSNLAAITANNANYITISGPSTNFKRIAYRNNNNANQYDLSITQNILLQCNKLNGGQCLNNSTLYAGSTTNLQILCGSNDCHFSDIYSSIQSTTSSLGDKGFNITCYPLSNTSCNTQFLLHFTDITCNIPNDPNCIHILSSSSSSSPSINPTLSPLTSSPSVIPSYSPSFEPTISPSSMPTKFPTFSPSKLPTDFPTVPPTLTPTVSPTYTPSSEPSLPPTNAPTVTPTYTPSSEPSLPPTNAPTITPTLSPTITPTLPPTNAPSLNPSETPTFGPTRHPTQDIYKQIIHIEYNLTNITRNISIQLHNDMVQDDLEIVLERSYLETSKELIQDPLQWLQFKDFVLNINEVITTPYSSDELITTQQRIGEYMNNYTNYTGTLKCDIRYANDSVGDNLRFISRRRYFQNFTQNELRKFFNDYRLILIVGPPTEDAVIGPIQSGEIAIFFLVIVCIGAICIMVAVASFIYNNWVKYAKTDNGNSFAITLYGLQMIDLFSDINLCVEMFLNFGESRYDPNRASLYIAGWGSLTFTLIPYITNLVLAVNIKQIKEIKENPFAKSYFQTTSWFFIVLVVFSGGVYPALSIVSSRLFAFEFLNSGLTMMELTKLTKVRFFTTILMENIPQLCCSLLYINYLGKVSQNTTLSLIMSVLQIIAAILNYIVMRIPTDCRVIQYDLEMEIKTTTKSQSQLLRNGDHGISQSSLDLDDITDLDELSMDEEGDDIESVVNRKYHDLFDMTQSSLTKEQKKQIRKRKERKASLRRWLCTELRLRLNAIEIGFVTLTPNGCIVHVIHYTFESEAKAFRDAKLKQLPNIDNAKCIELEKIKDLKPLSPIAETDKRWIGNIKHFEKIAKSFFKDMYKRNAEQVNCAFASHFEFKEERVTVKYHKRYPYDSWDMAHRLNFSFDQIQNADSPHYKQIPGPPPNQHDELEELQMPQMTQPTNIQLNAGNLSNLSEDSIHSVSTTGKHTPTDDLCQSYNEIQLLTIKIRQKLKDKSEDEEQVKLELLEEGWNEILIDKVMGIAKLATSMRQATNPDDSDADDSDADDEDEDDERDEHQDEDEDEDEEDVSVEEKAILINDVEKVEVSENGNDEDEDEDEDEEECMDERDEEKMPLNVKGNNMIQRHVLLRVKKESIEEVEDSNDDKENKDMIEHHKIMLNKQMTEETSVEDEDIEENEDENGNERENERENERDDKDLNKTKNDNEESNDGDNVITTNTQHPN